MSTFSDTHIITQFDELPVKVDHDQATVRIQAEQHSVALTLTSAQFAELAEVCKAVAAKMEAEKMA